MAFGSMRSSHIQHSSSSYSSSLFGILARFWLRFANHGLDIFYVFQHLSHQPCGFAIGQSLPPKMPWHLQKENRIGPKIHTPIIASKKHNLPTETQKWNPHDSQIFKWSWELNVGRCAGASGAAALRCRSTLPAVAASVAVPPPMGCKEWYSWDSASDSKPYFVSTCNGGGYVVCRREATIFNAKGPKARCHHSSSKFSDRNAWCTYDLASAWQWRIEALERGKVQGLDLFLSEFTLCCFKWWLYKMLRNLIVVPVFFSEKCPLCIFFKVTGFTR